MTADKWVSIKIFFNIQLMLRVSNRSFKWDLIDLSITRFNKMRIFSRDNQKIQTMINIKVSKDNVIILSIHNSKIKQLFLYPILNKTNTKDTIQSNKISKHISSIKIMLIIITINTNIINKYRIISLLKTIQKWTSKKQDNNRSPKFTKVKILYEEICPNLKLPMIIIKIFKRI